MKFTTWLFFFMSFIFTAETFAQTPFIPVYNAIKRSERCFTITEDVNSQFGGVWFRDKGDFSQDTTLYFVMYFGDKDDNGADGFGFVIHDDPRDTIFDGSTTYYIGSQVFNQEAATGDPGGGLGYGDYSDQTQNPNLKITPSVAIEFDTWDNNDVQDGANQGNSPPKSPYKGWDHTAVVYNGNMDTEQQIIENPDGSFDRLAPLAPISAWGYNHNVEDNGCYAFKIEWTVNNDGTQTLEMYSDRYSPDIVDAEAYNYSLIMRHTDDMINGVFGGETTLRFGFTGSTGGSRNEQTICLLGGNTRPTAQDDYASTSVGNTVVVDVESNDQDMDGDNLFVPTIVNQANNGYATVISVGSDNFIEYTPNAGWTGVDTVTYRTCDVDSDKCYALCDEADVIITVGCDDIFIDVGEIAPYTLCADSLAPDGAAEAFYVSGTARGTFWFEPFNQPNNTTSGGTPYTWNAVTDNSQTAGGDKFFYVEEGNFRARTRGSLGIFETDPIDISTVQNVNISLDIWEEGNLQASDSIKVVYSVDGGPEVELLNGSFQDDFGSATATSNTINGSSLVIRVYVRNTEGGSNQSKDHYWDNLLLTAVGPAAPPSLDFQWYEGSVTAGNFIGSGSTQTGLTDTTYYVFGIDPLTGCSSDTVEITIPKVLPDLGDVIIQQISPFTRCELPYDGALGAAVVEPDGDTVSTGYLFEWRLQANPGGPPIRVGSIADNLDVQDYRVTAYSQATGCLVGSVSDSLINEVRIPIVSPTVLNDVYSCVTNNGSVSATATKEGVPLTNDIGFLWYNGLLADAANPPDFVGSTISNLASGDYAVLVIDSTTMCTSESQNVNVQDLRQLPVPVVTNATDQISCDPNNPTGSFTSAVDDSGTNVTGGFTFNWYLGLNNVTPARAGYTDGPDVDALIANQYRLIVTNDTSGCQGVLDTAIIENIVNPVITDLDSTDVTVCGPGPNGSITVTPSGNIADYTYQYYSGNGAIPANLIADNTSNVLTDLDAGTYTVTITDNVTKCISPEVVITISDVTTVPTSTFSIIQQYACPPATPTGQIEATPDIGTANDYTFEWFVNDTTDTPLASTGGVNGEILGNLNIGTYALLLTNNTTLCQNVYFNVIQQNITYPVIDTAYSIASTFCGLGANGELHAKADGGSTDPAIFSFEWTDNLNNVVSSDSSAFNIVPGDYEVVVTNDTTLCPSNPFPVTVKDSTVVPDPVLNVTDNSSCDPTIANGQIEVASVPNEPAYTLSDYTYTYTDFTTGDPITAISGSDGQIADSLFEGTYNLLIFNNVTNCDNNVLSNVTDINLQPVINTVTINSHAKACADPYQSDVEVSSIELIDGSVAIPSDFSYHWIYLDGAPDTLIETSFNLQDIVAGGDAVPPGNYQVVAANDFGCESVPSNFTILDQSVLPTLSLTPFDNRTCNPALPNGIVEAVITSTETTDDVIFRWEDTASPGVFLTDTIGSGSGQNAINLTNGTYKATVITKATQCSNSYFADINNIQATIPLIDTLRTQDITVCIPPNGEIAYFVDPLETLPNNASTNHTYTFYLDTNSGVDSLNFTSRLSTDPSNINDDSVVFTGLAVDSYFAMVVDEFNHCASPTIQVSLEQDDGIDLTVVKSGTPSSCNGGDGEITVSASSTLNPGGLSGFEIDVINYFLDITDSASATLINSGNNVYSLITGNLNSGFYAIEATDNETGCFNNTLVSLESTQPPALRVDGSLPTYNCVPGNGQIDFTIIDQGTGTPEDFDILLFTGNIPDPANLIQTNTAPPLSPWNYNSSFTGLNEGEYYIITRSNIDGCFSNDSIINIIYDGPTPTFDLTSTPDITCSGALNGTGTLTLNGAPDAGYDFTWYDVVDTAGTPINGPGAPDNISNLFSGMYSIRIIDTDGTLGGGGLGCRYKVNKQILSDPEYIVITDAPVIDQSNCFPVNGEVYVFEVEEAGNPPTTVNIEGNPDYIFVELFDADLNSIDQSAGGPPYLGMQSLPFASLAANQYFVRTKNENTNCISPPYQVTINDVTTNPQLTISLDRPDYSCINGNHTGELSANVTGIPGDYTYTWYKGGDVTNPGNIFTPPVSPNPWEADELSAGFYLGQSDSLYSVLVVDNNGADGNLGCSTSISRRVPYRTGPIIITDAITDQDICGPNGTIEIVSINEAIFGSVSADYTLTYTVKLLDENLGTIADLYSTFDPVTGFFTSVPEGTYYTQAQNIQTGCPYGQINQAVIKDVSNNPIINIEMLTPDYACQDIATHTGELLSRAFGGSDLNNVPGNFIFTWSDTLGGNQVNNPLYSGLDDGIYEVTVIDDLGLDSLCQSTRRFAVTTEIQEIVIVDAVGTDQSWCNPNGTFWVEGLQVNDQMGPRTITPIDIEFGNYDINIFENDISNLVRNGLAADTIKNLNATTFFAVAVNKSTLCESSPRQFILEDISEDPVINTAKLSDNYSLNYVTPLSLTGIVEAEAFEGDGSSTGSGGYNYTWYRNELDNPDSLIATASGVNGVQTLDYLRDAQYFVNVESDSTGCISTAVIDVPFVYLKPIFTPIPSAQDICLPPNGNIVINSIRKVPDSTETFNKYVFDWHIGDYDKNNPDSVKAGSNNGNRLDGLTADDYYVQALDTWWLVESDPVQVTVQDSTVFPVIQYSSALSEDQRSCNPAFPNGALGVNVPGFDTYAYEWYDSPSATGPIISMTNSVTLQDAGTYTIVVRSTTTGCATERQFEIKDNIVLPTLTSSTSPVTNCIPELANGIANATIVNINPVSAKYDFYWYQGTSATGTPAFTDLADVFNDKINSAYINIPAGFYTVVAQDTFDCVSAPLTIEIVEDLVYPSITVEELHPLTYCDPTKPNAAMSALADGKVAGYSFQWNVKNGPLYGVGPVISNLSDELYTLIVTNSATGCMSLRDVRPSVSYKRVPDPFVDILSDMTSCIYPNGQAQVGIFAPLSEHQFTFLSDELNPITDNINGTIISELDFNDYFVFATDRISGCISDTVGFLIKDGRYYPEFDFITTPSFCNEATGEGEVIIADLTKEFKVRWFTESGDSLGSGRTLNYQPSGQYLVEVEGTDGCFNEADVFIGTDIIIYNGVSANFDNLNEAFYIECIDIFPNNNVKIFNRAGELIYEIDHYDSENPEKSFTGYSNRGPINGNKVAIGTYFYVVDLKDGSKPRVGYLELIR